MSKVYQSTYLERKSRESRYNRIEGRKQENIIQRRQVSAGYQLKYLDKN